MTNVELVLHGLEIDPRRDLYEAALPNNRKGHSGEYCLSYSGGRFPRLTEEEVQQLLRSGKIKRKWRDINLFILAKESKP